MVPKREDFGRGGDTLFPTQREKVQKKISRHRFIIYILDTLFYNSRGRGFESHLLLIKINIDHIYRGAVAQLGSARHTHIQKLMMRIWDYYSLLDTERNSDKKKIHA